MPEANPLNSHGRPANYWRNEARLCAADRMFGCAAFALSQWLEEHPEMNTPLVRQQIETWKAVGDVAVHDTAQARAARSLEEGRARRRRRFNTLLRRAEKGSLTETEQSELAGLAYALDDEPVSPQGAL